MLSFVNSKCYLNKEILVFVKISSPVNFLVIKSFPLPSPNYAFRQSDLTLPLSS